MMKNVLFAVVLASLALAVGCAKGGNGEGDGISVTVATTPAGLSEAGVTLSFPVTATVKGTTNTAVTWSLSGASCSGSGNPCGTLSATTGATVTYQAPSTVPANPAVVIKALSQADNLTSGVAGLTIVDITTTVAPTPVNVGQGLVQQFTAVAVPDNAPQTFSWSCSASGAACANFTSNSSGVAVYTAQDAACGNGCVIISAASTIDPNGCTNDAKACTSAKASVVATRITGSYAFHFSGFDTSNHRVAVAGAIAVTNGVISGVEDELTASGPAQYAITGGSYIPSTLNDHNSNNAGTLKLTTGAYPNQFQIVLDAEGDIQMIESDGHGTGSGEMKKSAASQFNTAAQTFVFGMTGVDANAKRIGYVGLLPLDGSGNVKTGAMFDSNDNGAASTSNAGGMYQVSASNSSIWQLTLTSAVTQHFDFYIGPGQTKNAKNPLTLYVISTDPVDSTHPALAGTIVFQDTGTTYDKTALNSDSISHLTGVDSTGSNAVVSLLAGTGDGAGNFDESFDSNNAGSIVPAATTQAPCTYTTSTGGRYVVTLFGTGTNTCTGGLPFVLYASGANRGFLLDQSSAAVMTGAMDPQTGNGAFSPAGLASTYAVATGSSATSAVVPVAANLLLTSTGIGTYNVAGTQYVGGTSLQTQTVAGAYTVMFSGTGTITLTTPAASYVIYAVDQEHFEMIDVDKAVTNPSVMFAEQ